MYFYRSGTLVKKGLVRLASKPYSRGGDDLTEMRLTLDRRVLDCLVGLDKVHRRRQPRPGSRLDLTAIASRALAPDLT